MNNLLNKISDVLIADEKGFEINWDLLAKQYSESLLGGAPTYRAFQQKLDLVLELLENTEIIVPSFSEKQPKYQIGGHMGISGIVDSSETAFSFTNKYHAEKYLPFAKVFRGEASEPFRIEE